jgi:hypothetical protein
MVNIYNMKIVKEVREERNDVYSFWVNKEVESVNGVVVIEEKIDETTELALLELKEKTEKELAIINEKLILIQDA